MNTISTPYVNLAEQAADGLLALMLAYRADERANKLDLGIGVYRDEKGITPVMRSVKEAELALLERQETKVYLGVDGNTEFVRRLASVVFGSEFAEDPRLIGMQSPGGTGALRLAAELIATNTANRRVWMGTPTWPNHQAIFRAAGAEVVEFPFYNPLTQTIDLNETLNRLNGATQGDAVLLHGCCHNPTGVDFAKDEWSAIAEIIVSRGLIPIVDLAYQGLGRGLDEDTTGLRTIFEACETVIVAYSCDKNFGLYRERTGAFWVKAPDAATVPTLQNAMRSPARAAWSMPPDHGAAVVNLILENDDLAKQWRSEIDEMRGRLIAVRDALANKLPSLGFLRDQTGIFSIIPISRDAVMSLRREQAIYLADDGRVNIAGLNTYTVDRVADALDRWL